MMNRSKINLIKNNVIVQIFCYPTLYSSRHLLIVDVDIGAPTSSRVSLNCFDVVRLFFFAKERILPSATLDVFRGLPGLLMLQSLPVHSFFLRMYQIVDLATPNALAISLRDLFSFFSAMMASFTGIDSSLDFMLVIPVAQLQKGNLMLQGHSKTLSYFIFPDERRERITPGLGSACQWSKSLLNPWKLRYST